jgi:GxxExxY protein
LSGSGTVASEQPIRVIYTQVKRECGFRLDLLVEDKIVIERKSVEAVAPVRQTTILTYLPLSHYRIGLLIDVAMLRERVRRYMI